MPPRFQRRPDEQAARPACDADAGRLNPPAMSRRLIMAMVDVAGAMPAIRRAGSRVVTVAVNSSSQAAGGVGDIVSFHAEVAAVGKSSVTVDVEVFAERNPKAPEVVKVTEARASPTWRWATMAASGRSPPRPRPSTPRWPASCPPTREVVLAGDADAGGPQPVGRRVRRLDHVDGGCRRSGAGDAPAKSKGGHGVGGFLLSSSPSRWATCRASTPPSSRWATPASPGCRGVSPSATRRTRRWSRSPRRGQVRRPRRVPRPPAPPPGLTWRVEAAGRLE